MMKKIPKPTLKCSKPPLSRVIPLALATSLLSWTGSSFAIGLGALKHSSYIGEPLTAELQILDQSADLHPEDVRIRQIIDPDKLKEINTNIYPSNIDLTFETMKKDGQIVVKVSTKQPIRDPFIEVLLVLYWADGRTYREYTLLLDLPPVPSKSAPPRARNIPSAPEKKPSRILGAGADAKSYRVRSGDTLSEIAQNWRQGTDYSIRETEDWLFDNNPQAFNNNNRNQLRLGAVLQLPAGGNLTPPTPQTENTQNRDHSLAGATTETPNTSSAQPSETSGGRLRVEEETIGVDELSQVDIDAKDSREIETLINITHETADRIIRENEELRRRIEQIESSEYVNNMEKMIALQNQEIEVLNQRLAETIAAANTPINQSPGVEMAPAAASSNGLPDWLIALVAALTGGLIAGAIGWRGRQNETQYAEPLTTDSKLGLSSEYANIAAAKPHVDAVTPRTTEQVARATDSAAMRKSEILKDQVRPQNAMPNDDFDQEPQGLSKVYLPSLEAEELTDNSEEQDFSKIELNELDTPAFEEELFDTAYVAPPADDSEELSFDLTLNDDDLLDEETSPNTDDDLLDLESSLFDDDVEEKISMSRIFGSFGDYEKAEETLQSAIALYPDDERLKKAAADLAAERNKNA